MDRAVTDYSQSGLPTSPHSAFTDTPSEASSADPASAAHFAVAHASRSALTTAPSDYPGLPPSAARAPSNITNNNNNSSTSSTSTFPDYLQQRQQQYQDAATLRAGAYHAPSSNHSSSSGGMTQSASPSSPPPPSLPYMALPAAAVVEKRQSSQTQTQNHHHHLNHNHHHHSHLKSDRDVPIDPSIATASPTYPPQGYYPQQHDMQQYAAHAAHAAQAAEPLFQERPNWAQYGGSQAPHAPHHHQHYPSHVSVPLPNPSVLSTSGARMAPPLPAYPMTQVYSFIPIPGSQQNKRARRRFEEIERMYKCGWKGCEKAYGTLNHLNAHVTMQTHGTKRTPEEFKEIRREWKLRRKEEDLARKAEGDDQRARSSQGPAGDLSSSTSHGKANASAANGTANSNDTASPESTPNPSSRQLPPIAYGGAGQQPAAGSSPHFSGTSNGVEMYSANSLYSSYPASSSYDQAGS
ncbi:MAG: hypothetical protein M1829_004653 [Trizodia sp. TS-e1964]|nr:MAG: hypothetical protein M1829_004653 [Trizodia sp. TS-e1964]